MAPVWGHVFLVGGCQFQSVGGVGTGFGFVGLDVDWRGVGWACSTADIKFSSLAFDLTVPLATEGSGLESRQVWVRGIRFRHHFSMLGLERCISSSRSAQRI